MTEWTMNSSSLAKGMLVRRPGLDEALEVVKVQGGQAKIKLPDGKTSTIPASAEVEWSWPTPSDQSLSWGEPRAKDKADSKDVIEATSEQDDTVSDTATEWLTSWSLLAAGSKITVLGETGEFTILRKTDSSARIKHDATGQIQTLSIGHKFKLVEGEGSTGTAESAKPGKTKADKAGKAAKGKTKSKPSAKPAPEPEAESETESDQSIIDDDEPSDDELAAIENGDGEDEAEIGEIEDMDDDSEIDPASLRELDDYEDETDANDTDTEEDDMPAAAPAPKKSPRSTPAPRSTSLLTVGQISERTGISYPTLMRYIRDHSHRLPSEGEGRARRFTPDAIDVFRQIRSETKGGRKPGSSTVSRANSASASARRPKPAPKPNRPTQQERSHETAAPYAAPARKQVAAVAQLVGSPRSQSSAPHSSSIDTLDNMLVSTIDAARVKIAGLEALVENLEAQREQLKLWS